MRKYRSLPKAGFTKRLDQSTITLKLCRPVYYKLMEG